MSAIKIPTPLVTDDEVAAGQISRNSYLLDQRTNYTNGGLAKGVMGTAGDSIAGYATGPQSFQDGDELHYGSPLQMMRAYHYCADFILDSRPYYKENPDGSDSRIDGQRGHGFAKGGSSLSHFFNTQVPFILEYPPEFLYFGGFQNGNYWMSDQTLASKDMAFFKDGMKRLTDEAGITVFVRDVCPHTDVGGGTNLSYHKHRVSHELRNYCAKTPGLHFIPFFEKLKSGDVAREQSGIVDWAPGTDVGDGLHEGPYGGWLEAEAHAAVFRRVMPEYVTPVLDLRDFNATFNPYGNVLGPTGAMQGTGGLINGVANNSVPAGMEITYPADKGVTLVPSIIIRNRRPVLRLTQAGTVTPTGDGTITVGFPITKAMPSALYESFAFGRWTQADGWGGLAMGGGFPIRNRVGSIGAANVMPFTLDRPWKLLTPRPRSMANSAGNRIDITLLSSFVSGVPFGGTLEIEGGFFGKADSDV